MAIKPDTQDASSAWKDVEDIESDDTEEPALGTDQDASYCCWACGEEIVIPIDLTMGVRQDYVEDCPVCCRPNEIHVELELESGHVRCWNDAVG